MRLLEQLILSKTGFVQFYNITAIERLHQHFKFIINHACSHLFGGVYVRFAVQTAYPPPLQGLIFSRLQRGLPLEGGTVAGLQACLLIRWQVLGLCPNHPCRLHIPVSLEFSSVWKEQTIMRNINTHKRYSMCPLILIHNKLGVSFVLVYIFF